MASLFTLLHATIIIAIIALISGSKPNPNWLPEPLTTTDEILQNTRIELIGKLAIVTGATDGLGRETTLALATAGCTVIMAVRDMEKAKQVKEEIIMQIFNERNKIHNSRGFHLDALEENLVPMYLDLNSLQSVQDFTRKFYQTYSQPLDYLILNAGMHVIYIYMVSI